jgi:hypothetical protein
MNTLCAAWTSSDGGTTFTRSALPLSFPQAPGSPTFLACASPEIAAGPQTRWHVAYVASSPYTAIVAASSSDGLTWANERVIDGSSMTVSFGSPAIAVDRGECSSYTAGRVYVVYVEPRPRAPKRSGWLRRPTGDELVQGQGRRGTSTRVLAPRVAVDPAGAVYVAWLDGGTNQIKIDRSASGGLAFGTDKVVASVTGGVVPAGRAGVDLGCSGGLRHASTPSLAVDQSWGPSRGDVLHRVRGPRHEHGPFLDALPRRRADRTSPAPLGTAAARHQYGPSNRGEPQRWRRPRRLVRPARRSRPTVRPRSYHARSDDRGQSWTPAVAVTSTASAYDGDPRGEGARVAFAVGTTVAQAAWTGRQGSDFEILASRAALQARHSRLRTHRDEPDLVPCGKPVHHDRRRGPWRAASR